MPQKKHLLIVLKKVNQKLSRDDTTTLKSIHVDQNNYNKARFVVEPFFALVAVIVISAISMMKDSN